MTWQTPVKLSTVIPQGGTMADSAHKKALGKSKALFWGASQSLPQAIVHVDGDAFFASCEQAVHPEYKGKPVITGKERGIVASLSYEAKARGIKRGMRLMEAKELCPEAIMLPSDYETYSLFSKRMFSIMRRFTSMVEEYSIDEGFGDLTGLRRPMRMSYYQMAEAMKVQLDTELGFTVSIGLAPTKVLAKVGSKWKKPNGLTIITGKTIEYYLAKLPLIDVWGIGPNTANYLYKFGLRTALDFIRKPEVFVQKHMTKPHQEIWQELQGVQVYEIETTRSHHYYSISKAKTFTPASRERNFVYAQLIKNLENACIKARRHNLVATKLAIFLRNQSFETHGFEAKLSRSSAYPNEMLPLVETLFNETYRVATLYRQTAVVLSGLEEDSSIQVSLFEPPLQLTKMKSVYSAIDGLAQKYGKHTVYLATGFQARSFAQHLGSRGDIPERQITRLPGETRRQRLNLPLLRYPIN